jgi:hypothetical protein
MHFLSSDALSKFSPVIGFSHLDHPIDRIEHDPIRVSTGSVGVIALTQTKVNLQFLFKRLSKENTAFKIQRIGMLAVDIKKTHFKEKKILEQSLVN